MKVIDVHTHIFPDNLAKRASESVGNFYELPMDSDGLVSSLIVGMEQADIEKCLICSVAVKENQVRSINDFIINECEKHKRFIGFAAMHPDMIEFEEELNRIVENGLKGVKFHSDFQQFNIDDEKMFPIYRAIEEKGLPILFHMGDTRYSFSSPIRLRKVCEMFPQLVVIAAHFGGYQNWGAAYELPKYQNLYFDTSSSLAFLNQENAVKMIHRFGANHFMFGSDFPMWNQKAEMNRLLRLGLDQKSLQKIFHENFERIIEGI